MLRGAGLLWGAIFLLVLANWLWAFDWNAFRLGSLQSLCRDCHNRKWVSDRHGYRSDMGDDGLPVDPRHPFNRRK